MKINTNSNTYTILYAAGVVVVVAFLLAFAYAALKERSDANERIDKKQQILAALNIRGLDKADVETKYKEVVLQDMIVDAEGNVVNEGTEQDKAGFAVDRKDFSGKCLPLYVCNVDGQKKYVLPMVGKGLWGGIWGFVALDEDAQTVFGSYFSHESETAGLGALIKDQPFQDRFAGKKAYADGAPALTVVKSGAVKDAATEVDGITGATLTSNGVRDMIKEYLELYKAFLSK
ncbi:MAG: NADH:ubiquinone reductase (Na(+)-transporting) subunit C [Alloprevotella sp.]|nr:NADH:ubiquinone reductase (Na(+)-transporting) subunit C [Alloprevotella sp.]MBR1652617.1 NADH:ubiquinone reductase (Na(+)-transporting) subunit C [Alloprevotella sp.]